ncbi:hypothetical protein ACHAXT_004550 [Thalassiosira profunda]
MTRVRAGNVAAATTLASRHVLMALMRRTAMPLALLAALFAAPALAFSPGPCKNYVGSTLCRRAELNINSGHRPRTCLSASEDGTDNTSESPISEDDDNDDEIDLITQKLSRNAGNGPINPVKEHDKMVEESLLEANASTDGSNSTDTAPSTLYSHVLANAADFDPSASTDEAYVESQMKELLSRKGKELSRLGPGIATLPLDPSSTEAKSEETLSEKECELQRVVAEAKERGKSEWDEFNLEESPQKQTEILERAHQLQTEIDQLHVDDCGAVLLANLQFYEAFSLKDADHMKEVWWQSPSALCIHPSHPPLIGSNAVCNSFATMFDNGMKGGTSRAGGNGAASSGGVFMTPTNIRGLSVRGTTASLVCDEEVYSKGSGESVGRQGGILVNKLLTTNVFRKIGGKWKMVHRHASWHPETTAAQEAMKAEPGFVLYDSTKASTSTKSARAKGMSLERMKGSGTSERPVGLSNIPSSLDGLDANAVLGIPAPKEEETKKAKSSEDGMLGKIINLSDLLGGGGEGDSDGEKEEDKAIGDALADMLMGGDSGSSQTTGSGTPEDPFITRRVIKIGPEGIENVGGLTGNKDKKKDDEEDKEIVIDLRDKSEEERQEVLSKIVGDAMKGDSSVVDASVSESSPKNDKEESRKRCIATLRKLSEQGLISSKQKRVLLTDIISSAAREETSVVEVAHELLVSGEDGDDSEDAETDADLEDFAEQCKTFAEEAIAQGS